MWYKISSKSRTGGVARMIYTNGKEDFEIDIDKVNWVICDEFERVNGQIVIHEYDEVSGPDGMMEYDINALSKPNQESLKNLGEWPSQGEMKQWLNRNNFVKDNTIYIFKDDDLIVIEELKDDQELSESQDLDRIKQLTETILKR